MLTIIYTDASYDRTQETAGICCVIRRRKDKDSSDYVARTKIIPCTDSNIAELEALKFATSLLDEQDKFLLLHMDNQPAIRAVKHPNRKEFSIEKSKISNEIRETLKKADVFHIRHIKAHTGSDQWNQKLQTWCDFQARKALRENRKNNKRLKKNIINKQKPLQERPLNWSR